MWVLHYEMWSYSVKYGSYSVKSTKLAGGEFSLLQTASVRFVFYQKAAIGGQHNTSAYLVIA